MDIQEGILLRCSSMGYRSGERDFWGGLLFLLIGFMAAPTWGCLLGGAIKAAWAVGLALVGVGCLLLGRFALRVVRGEHVDAGAARTGAASAALAVGALWIASELAATVLMVVRDDLTRVNRFRLRERHAFGPERIPHPFLLLTANPRRVDVNSLGFIDREHPRAKRPGTFRIACLGGSTTEDGYPRQLERMLEAEVAGRSIEVLNFGAAAWTTAQTLVNYLLNVQYFSPDLIIVHHGSNELKVRYHAPFRTDYAHAFRPLVLPNPAPDVSLVRYSNSYAYAKLLLHRAGLIRVGADVYELVMNPVVRPAPFADDQLEPFVRNVSDLITISRAHGTRVVLTTQPFSRGDLRWHTHWVEHMEGVNALTRRVAAELKVPLVDLDAAMRDDSTFVDPIHLIPTAVESKARLIADRIVPLIARDE